MALLSLYQTGSMGLRLGELDGWKSRAIPWSVTHFLIYSCLWPGVPSCWNVIFPLFLLISAWKPFKTFSNTCFLYLAALNPPPGPPEYLRTTNSPFQPFIIQPQIITQTGDCLNDGARHSSIHSLPGRHVTYTRPLLSPNWMYALSDQITRD